MDQRPKFIVRFPNKQMREAFKIEAKRQNRSLNEHIIYILKNHAARQQHKNDGHSRPQW